MRTHISYYQIQRFLHKWHRRIGLLLAIVFLPVALSGILINHTDDFGLADVHLNFQPLLSLYGINTPDTLQHFVTDEHTISLLKHQVFIDAHPIDLQLEHLLGAVATPTAFVLLDGQQLVLLTLEGELIERLSAIHGLPDVILNISAQQNTIWLKTPTHLLTSHDGLLSWEKTSSKFIAWSEPQTPSAALKHRLLAQYQGKGLSLERVLLDIHSGRILGHWSKYLMDFAGFGIIYLVFTGFFMWLKKYRHKKHG